MAQAFSFANTARNQPAFLTLLASARASGVVSEWCFARRRESEPRRQQQNWVVPLLFPLHFPTGLRAERKRHVVPLSGWEARRRKDSTVACCHR